mmetsp:Transcript_38694/g.76271  ORF Transcript_38694/g.76271 Transcript_38694/m.76271 type:complete len:618 (+) Transcript_38694:3-1856(+)
MAQEVANAAPGGAAVAALAAVAASFADPSLDSVPSVGAVVYVGRDTRRSSPRLNALAVKGAQLCGAEVRDLGLVTTPQLHHVVRMRNVADGVASHRPGGLVPGSTGVEAGDAEKWASEAGYFEMLADAYVRLTSSTATPMPSREVVVDASGGVGALKLQPLQAAIHKAAAKAAAAMHTAAGKEAEAQRAEKRSKVAADGDAYSSGQGGVTGGVPVLNFVLVNGVDSEGSGLNEGCGAEFVQKGRQPPKGLLLQSGNNDGGDGSGGGGDGSSWQGRRLCSFDGDGDRLVYHFYDHSSSWHLLDGDKIATLFADFLGAEFRAAGLMPTQQGAELTGEEGGGRAGVGLAVVQTAYANGASSAYLRSQGLTLDFAKTGVKFVHHVALKHDVGVYFEANGHGTVLFQPHVVEALKAELARLTSLSPEGGGGRAVVALERLLAFHQLVNQAVGDALSDLLCIEAILAIRGWGSEEADGGSAGGAGGGGGGAHSSSSQRLGGVKEWDALYCDLPSRQSKLPVKDRTVVQCSADETQTTNPPGLQERLNELMAAPAADAVPGGISSSSGGGSEEPQLKRCFVRPSGTEDVVRVYAEAATQLLADALAVEAARAVFDFAGGVGARP